MTFSNILSESGPEKVLTHFTDVDTLLQIFETGGLLFQEYPYSKTNELEMCTIRSSHHPNPEILGTNGEGVKIIIQFHLLNDIVRGLHTKSTNEYVLLAQEHLRRFSLDPFAMSRLITPGFIEKFIAEHGFPYFGLYDYSMMGALERNAEWQAEFKKFNKKLNDRFSEKNAQNIFLNASYMIAYQVQREYEERIYVKKKTDPVEIIKIPFERVNKKDNGAILFNCNTDTSFSKGQKAQLGKYIALYPNIFTPFFKKKIAEVVKTNYNMVGV